MMDDSCSFRMFQGCSGIQHGYVWVWQWGQVYRNKMVMNLSPKADFRFHLPSIDGIWTMPQSGECRK